MIKQILAATLLLFTGCALNFEDHAETLYSAIPSESVEGLTIKSENDFSSDITVYGKEDSDSLKAKAQVNQLILKNEKAASVQLAFRDEGENTKSLGYVTNSYNWESISIDEFRAEIDNNINLGIISTSGDINVKGMKGRVNVKATSGDVTVNTDGDCKVKATSGDVIVSSGAGVNIDATSGDVTATAITSAFIDATSGDVSLKITEDSEEFTGITLDVTSGDIKLYLPKGFSAWLSLKATSGDISIKGNEKDDNSYNGSLNGGTSDSRKITIKATSGDVSIIEY